VEFYELRADAGVIRKGIAHFGAKAALHAKVVVLDLKASCSTPMRCRPSASYRSTSRPRPSTCSRCPGTNCTPPKASGVLYLRRGTRFRPLLRGGYQEGGRRAGTENSASIVVLGKAYEPAQAHIDDERTQVAALRDRLEQGRLEAVPSSFVTGDPCNRLPNTSNIAFEFIEGEAILLLLNKLGIAASSGSPFTSGSLEPSHVMRAMDIPYTAAHGTTRFSLSRYTTAAVVERVIEAVPPVVAQLRKLFPYWEGERTEKEQSFQPSYT
jgi:cysteine desulfurase